MRIATLIVGLVFSLWLMIEGWIGNILSSMGGSERTSNAVSWGFFAGVIALFGSALVVAFPLVSMFVFIVAGLFSVAAASSGYGNHEVFSIVLFSLAIASLLGWRGKRKEMNTQRLEQTRQTERDQRLESLLSEGPSVREANQIKRCQSCGEVNPFSSHFCASCGRRLAMESS